MKWSFSKTAWLKRCSLSPATVAVFSLLAVGASTQTGTVGVYLENQTVLLGRPAHFFCQFPGKYEDLRLRIDGGVINLSFTGPDLNLTTENTTLESVTVHSINITISGTRKRNNTLLECYDKSVGRENFPTATLTVIGGPAEPEVEYGVSDDQREILLSWPRPFTWRDYPITGYLIECRDSQSELLHSHINGTEIVNATVVNQTVELPQDIPDCYSFQCSVTASNNLDESPSSIINISLPLTHISPKPAVDLVKMVKLEDGRPGIAICVKLPILCEFQSVRYKVVISSGGDPVLQFTRVFSYSSGYSSQCIEEKVNDTLKEGTEYEVQVFLYAGESGNSTSDTHTFKTYLATGRTLSSESNGMSGDGHTSDSDDTAKTGFIVDIAMGTVMVIVIIILFIFAFIVIGMWRATKNYRVVMRSGRPTGATNKVFDHEAFPLNCEDRGKNEGKAEEEPYYHTLEASVEQKTSRPPSEPVYSTPFSDIRRK